LARISDVIDPFFVMATSAGTSFPRNVQVGAPGSAFPGPPIFSSNVLSLLIVLLYLDCLFSVQTCPGGTSLLNGDRFDR
jgi:hypothetical protein